MPPKPTTHKFQRTLTTEDIQAMDSLIYEGIGDRNEPVSALLRRRQLPYAYVAKMLTQALPILAMAQCGWVQGSPRISVEINDASSFGLW